MSRIGHLPPDSVTGIAERSNINPYPQVLLFLTYVICLAWRYFNVPLASLRVAFSEALEKLNGIGTGALLRLCKRKGIEDLHFHDLRHEATSRLFEKGLNPVEVATITGHKDTKMLMRYTHLRAEDLVRRLG